MQLARDRVWAYALGVSQNLVQLRRNRGDLKSGERVLDTALARLARVMNDKREITREDVSQVARATGQPEAAVYGVATYYGDLHAHFEGKRGETRVKVCKGTACHAACKDASVGWMEAGLGVRLGETSADGAVSLEEVYCLGFCNASPTVEVEGKVYGGLTKENAKALGKAVREKASMPLTEAHDALVPVFEVHDGPAIVLERLAKPIDATDLAVARANAAFEGLAKARAMAPADVLAEVERSQLRGRGGAGFATSAKWKFAAANIAAQPQGAREGYVVCNADEGDPGSYIDKYLMEKDPFAVLEGIAIAGHAIGATRGYVYVRSEYPRSAPVLRKAILDARAAGLLGGATGHTFDIDVVDGAGSYVCGEETALLRSLEGLRGMVTARPPYPADKGLFGKPTVVNNVETLANLGWIVRNGGAAYEAIGVGKSRGTKAVSLNERFAKPGVYEVPMGISLRRVLFEIGGGLRGGAKMKALQIGGPLGGILPGEGELLDAPLGFEELDAVGALLGHGGMVAWDDTVDARDIAVHLFAFCDAESCGKCFPCRIGGRRGLEIAERLKETRPKAEVEGDLALLGELLETLKLGSLCAHGGAIPDPIRSLLRHFPAEMSQGGV